MKNPHTIILFKRIATTALENSSVFKTVSPTQLAHSSRRSSIATDDTSSNLPLPYNELKQLRLNPEIGEQTFPARIEALKEGCNFIPSPGPGKPASITFKGGGVYTVHNSLSPSKALELRTRVKPWGLSAFLSPLEVEYSTSKNRWVHTRGYAERNQIHCAIPGQIVRGSNLRLMALGHRDNATRLETALAEEERAKPSRIRTATPRENETPQETNARVEQEISQKIATLKDSIQTEIMMAEKYEFILRIAEKQSFVMMSGSHKQCFIAENNEGNFVVITLQTLNLNETKAGIRRQMFDLDEGYFLCNLSDDMAKFANNGLHHGVVDIDGAPHYAIASAPGIELLELEGRLLDEFHGPSTPKGLELELNIVMNLLDLYQAQFAAGIVHNDGKNENTIYAPQATIGLGRHPGFKFIDYASGHRMPKTAPCMYFESRRDHNQVVTLRHNISGTPKHIPFDMIQSNGSTKQYPAHERDVYAWAYSSMEMLVMMDKKNADFLPPEFGLPFLHSLGLEQLESFMSTYLPDKRPHTIGEKYARVKQQFKAALSGRLEGDLSELYRNYVTLTLEVMYMHYSQSHSPLEKTYMSGLIKILHPTVDAPDVQEIPDRLELAKALKAQFESSNFKKSEENLFAQIEWILQK